MLCLIVKTREMDSATFSVEALNMYRSFRYRIWLLATRACGLCASMRATWG
jgi:hypothetical protein